MNQSALVGGVLLAGFVLFLAAQDRLTVYGHVLFSSDPHGSTGKPASEGGSTGGSSASSPFDIFGDYGIGIGDVGKATGATDLLNGTFDWGLNTGKRIGADLIGKAGGVLN